MNRVDNLFKSFSKLTNIERVSLSISNNLITDIKNLKNCFTDNKYLKELNLDLSNNKI